MKLLHTADWHLGKRLEGRNRHEEQVAVMDEICQLVEREEIDAVLIAGDIYDTYNPPAESERLYYETAARLSDGGRRAVVVIAGNHDSPDRLKASDPYGRALGVVTLGLPHDSAELFDRGEGKVACVESAPSFVRLRLRNGEHLNLLALSYPSEARLRQLLSSRIDDEDAGSNYDRAVREFMEEGAKRFREGEANVLISHLFVRGGTETDSERQIMVGGSHLVSTESFPEQAGYIGLGHLHRPQEFRSRSGAMIRYSGSPLQYSFSEAGQEKSVTIVEFAEEAPSEAIVRIEPLSTGRALIDRKGLKGLAELEEFLTEADPDAWIAFSLLLDEALPLGYTDRLHTFHKGIITPLFNYREKDRQDEEGESLEELSLEEQFRRFVASKGEEVNDEVVELFLKIASESD